MLDFSIAMLIIANSLAWLLPVSSNALAIIMLFVLLFFSVGSKLKIQSYHSKYIVFISLALFVESFILTGYGALDEDTRKYFVEFVTLGIPSLFMANTNFRPYKVMGYVCVLSVPMLFYIRGIDMLTSRIDYGYWMGISYGIVKYIIVLCFAVFFVKKFNPAIKLGLLVILFLYVLFYLEFASRGAIVAVVISVVLFYLVKKDYTVKKTILVLTVFAMVLYTLFFVIIQGLYELFNSYSPFYSYDALSKIEIKRLGNSDLIDISYKSTDPGITLNTVKLVSEELRLSYEGLRYKTTNDIISYYQNELNKLRTQLNKMENDLTNYNIENSIINYGEQTKAIASSFSNFENRYEETMRNYESSTKLIEELEQYMQTRTELVKTNEEFIKALAEITTISGKITEIETFTSEDKQIKDNELIKYKDDLLNAEKKIAIITDKINNYKESKEGISIDGLVQEWLRQTIINIKAKAELKILNIRKEDYLKQYKIYSPIGTVINRQGREIKIVEESYLQVLHALNMAKLKQKNILLTSATLNTISNPTYPLMSDKSKRMLLTISAFLGSLVFILGLNLVIELLDRTLRDAERAERLIGLPVLGAFNGNTQLKYRGFVKACNRISAIYTCNRLNQYLKAAKKDELTLEIIDGLLAELDKMNEFKASHEGFELNLDTDKYMELQDYLDAYYSRLASSNHFKQNDMNDENTQVRLRKCLNTQKYILENF